MLLSLAVEPGPSPTIVGQFLLHRPVPPDMETWADLFERGADHETTVATVREALATRRGDDARE